MGNLLLFSGYSFFVAFTCYFVGVLVLGYPAHWVLKRSERTGMIAASMVGGVLSGLVAWPMFGTSSSSLGMVGMTFIAGAVAGIVYRRTSEA